MPAIDAAVIRPPPYAPVRRPIEGPSAWVGADMRQREAEWSYRLSPAEVAEIEAAVQAVRARGLDLAEIHREDFPLPALGPVLDQLRGEVLNGRGFVLLRGMPVEDRPVAESATAYWGVGTYFGSARSQNAKGHLLGHVYDLGISAEKNPNTRGYATAERQDFHIDRCDIVAAIDVEILPFRSGVAARVRIFFGANAEIVDVPQQMPLRVLRTGTAEIGAYTPIRRCAFGHWPVLDRHAAQQHKAAPVEDLAAQLIEH